MERAKLLDADAGDAGDAIVAKEPTKDKTSGPGLVAAGTGTSMWGSLKKFMGAGLNEPNALPTPGPVLGQVLSPETRSVNRTGDTINVFSLASGHLYERFLKIMMLSVLNNTRSPVKFWFMKNCMSPQMKAFLPFMALEYGFQFELVHYNWPAWLNSQSEKQRLIWGYKVLTLLFHSPSLIFILLDQIYR